MLKILLCLDWNFNYRFEKSLNVVDFKLQESEETMSELKNVYEREKVMLVEENKRLQFEYERTVELNNRLQLERRQFEDEYQDLRNKKEAVAQWEAQISEIINW